MTFFTEISQNLELTNSVGKKRSQRIILSSDLCIYPLDKKKKLINACNSDFMVLMDRTSSKKTFVDSQ